MKLPKNLMDTLRDLVSLIGEDEIAEIEIERHFWGGGKIRISKVGQQAQVVQSMPSFAAPMPHALPASQVPNEGLVEEKPVDDDSRYHTLKSPMVGMFYRASSPEASAYVKEGDEVVPGQTLCIIEAMKIMNEIEADIKGRVVRVLAENAKPVEYNTPLFLIEPSK